MKWNDRWYGGVVATGLALVVAAGCGPTSDSERRGSSQAQPVAGIDDRRVRVVATTNFIHDLVTEVGGDRVDAVALMGPGVDPHLYKATAGDVEDLSEADAVFYGGLDLEAKLQDVLERSSSDRVVAAVTRDIERDRLLPAVGSTEHYDPHVWFDPDLWSTTPGVVAEVLGQIDPEHADDYRRRAKEHAEEIRAAGRDADEALAVIPERSRVLVTSHDAFRYFGRRFDMDVEAIQGISTASEATTADIDRIAELIAERRVRSVFVESSVPKRTIEAVIAAAQDRGWTASIGGSLFSDAAGDRGTPEATYVGMLRHNVDQLVEGLGAQPAAEEDE